MRQTNSEKLFSNFWGSIRLVNIIGNINFTIEGVEILRISCTVNTSRQNKSKKLIKETETRIFLFPI